MNKNKFKNQLMLLIFSSFLCLIYLKILTPSKVRDLNIFKFGNNMINYNKKNKKSTVKKVNYDQNFVETLLVSYALYYMSTDGVVLRPNIKNIAARACMSTTKLKKIFDKYDDELFKINYYKVGQRTYTDSITLKPKLFHLISVKKNQRRIHQEYVTTMVKTKLPKGPLATLVFYITVAHSNKNGASTITMKKISGILSQKYEKKRTIQDELELHKIEGELIKLSIEVADSHYLIKSAKSREILFKDAERKRNKLLDEKALILDKQQNFRLIKSPDFNNALEENIRHAMRALIKNGVLIKNKNKIFFLNLNSLKNRTEFLKDIHKDTNINNVEPGTTNYLFINKKETRLLTSQFFLNFFTKSQIENKKNFTKFLNSRKRIKILLAKTVRYFDEKIYCKARKCFAKNKWLMKKTFVCESLKERMKEKLREVVKSKYQFYNLSMYLSFFTFNQKIDLAILLFEKCMSFVAFKNMHEIKWDKFEFFNDLKKIYPPFLIKKKKKMPATFFTTAQENAFFATVQNKEMIFFK
jgi:hypothetical protein